MGCYGNLHQTYGCLPQQSKEASEACGGELVKGTGSLLVARIYHCLACCAPCLSLPLSNLLCSVPAHRLSQTLFLLTLLTSQFQHFPKSRAAVCSLNGCSPQLWLRSGDWATDQLWDSSRSWMYNMKNPQKHVGRTDQMLGAMADILGSFVLPSHQWVCAIWLPSLMNSILSIHIKVMKYLHINIKYFLNNEWKNILRNTWIYINGVDYLLIWVLY